MTFCQFWNIDQKTVTEKLDIFAVVARSYHNLHLGKSSSLVNVVTLVLKNTGYYVFSPNLKIFCLNWNHKQLSDNLMLKTKVQMKQKQIKKLNIGNSQNLYWAFMSSLDLSILIDVLFQVFSKI